jgi:hypothetical protein
LLSAGTSSGFGTARSSESGSIVGEPRSQATVNATGAAAASQAHQRQCGDGSDPVGVSSRMKPTIPSPGMKLTEESIAIAPAPGSEPGSASSPSRA